MPLLLPPNLAAKRRLLQNVPDVPAPFVLKSLYRRTVLDDLPRGYWRLGDYEGYAQAVLSNVASAYWRLNDALGATSAADSSGAGLTGTVNGAVTFRQLGALADGSTCAAFDGSTGW